MNDVRMLPLLLGCLLSALCLTATQAQEPLHVRVLELDAIDSREAVTLLRSEVQVRRIAELRQLGKLVVGGTAEKIHRCEALLRERNALIGAHAPHEPMLDDDRTERTIELRLDGLDPKAAAVLLRSMYQIRQIELGEAGLTVTASPARLDAAEATLDALGVLQAG